MQKLLSNIPSTWIAGGIAGLVTIMISLGLIYFNKYTNSIEDVVIERCNTTQLEEDLAFEKRINQQSKERLKLLENLLSAAEAEVVEVEVFRDRVITEVREVQVEVLKTEEGTDREEISPTTKQFIRSLQEESNE